MFEVSARWLPMVVSVLLATTGNAVAARGESPTVTGVGPEIVSALTSSLPARRMGESIPSQIPETRSNASMSIPMLSANRLLGAIGISLASERFLWLMLAMCLLSYGQKGQATLARRCGFDHDGQYCQQPSLSAEAPIADLQIPTCRYLCQQAIRKMSDESSFNKARVLVGPALVLEISGSRPARRPSPPLPALSSHRVSAQLGHGPPPMS